MRAIRLSRISYMRENSFIPEAEVDSETVRYSCDIPGQSLAYKIGDSEFLRLRAKVHAQLGAGFDVRKFHRAVLSPGGMPFPLLEWHIDRTFEAHANANPHHDHTPR